MGRVVRVSRYDVHAWATAPGLLIVPSSSCRSTVVCRKLFRTVALSFVCDKYYSIMDKLGLKDSSRDFQLNCVISFHFRLYLMFYACATRFDVTENLENFLVFRVN